MRIASNAQTISAEQSEITGQQSKSTGIASKRMQQGGIGKEQVIYTQRFSAEEEVARDLTWDVLVTEFFQHYISPDDTVIDVGAGDGLFIKKIKARRRIAVDLSEHVQALAQSGIEVHQIPADKLIEHIDEKADVIFMSNFLEHLPDKRVLLSVLEGCLEALRPGGQLMILQPNIRYVGPRYWDYIDHHIALTEDSLVEALNISGFTVCELIPRFLPYTAKSGIGRLLGRFGLTKFVVSLYLQVPILWRIFGAQTFVVATPTAVQPVTGDGRAPAVGETSAIG